MAERVVQEDEVKAVRAASTALETSERVATWTEQIGSSVLKIVSEVPTRAEARG